MMDGIEAFGKLIENYNMYSTVDRNNAPDILSSVLTYQEIFIVLKRTFTLITCK